MGMSGHRHAPAVSTSGKSPRYPMEAVSLQTGQPEFGPQQCQRIFSLTSVSRPARKPTQPPIQWVKGVFPGGKVRPGRDTDHSPHLKPWSRMNTSYTSSPPWHLNGNSGVGLFFTFLPYISVILTPSVHRNRIAAECPSFLHNYIKGLKTSQMLSLLKS
jgi:hypothetical protein